MNPPERAGEELPAPPHPTETEVVELSLGLTPGEWSTLEAVSRRRHLTVAQAARRVIVVFLRRELEADNWSVTDIVI